MDLIRPTMIAFAGATSGIRNVFFGPAEHWAGDVQKGSLGELIGIVG